LIDGSTGRKLGLVVATPVRQNVEQDLIQVPEKRGALKAILGTYPR
jgi:hypothetical protein